MESQFKNRLVGVTILVALVVIFLPSVIDGKKNAYQQKFATTPIKPNLKPHTKEFPLNTNLQDNKIVIEDVAQTDNEVVNNASKWKVEEIAEVKDSNENGIDRVVMENKSTGDEYKTAFSDPAWTIQLGAFQNKENINTLLKKLNKAGFQVHTIPTEVMEGQLTRVFVGPDISKKVLEEKLPRLKRLTDLDGKLVPFNPIEP